MANITEYLAKILSARYGKDVRGSIHDSIKAINDEVVDYGTEASKRAAEAKSSASSAATSASNASTYANNAKTYASNASASANTAKGKANEASASASSASDSASEAADALAEIKEKLASGEFKGEKGDTGAKGAAGADGEDGVSVTSIEQTTTSSADGGINVITVTLSNGKGSTFNIKNGSKGEKGDIGATGEKGEKGNTGSTGQRGSRWLQGTAITGTSTTATIFSGTGITDALVNDNYLNTSTGNTYRCTVAGNASTARWVYTGNIKGAKGDTPPLTNNLLATVSGTALDAAQGKVLCDKINNSIVVLNQTIITTSIAAATEATIAVSLPEDMDTLAIIPYVWIPTADWGTELKFQSVDVSAGTISAFAYGTTTQAYAVSYFLLCRVNA